MSLFGNNPENTESTTNSLVKEYLRNNEQAFTQQLELFGRKYDNTGFHLKRSSKGWEDLFTGKRIPEYWKQYSEGEFSGAGLCAIAAGVLEEALRKKFGDSIDVASYIIYTNDMDINTDWNLEDRRLLPHHIVRYKAKGSSTEYVVDPTYRQFNEKVKLSRMMLIAPRKAELHLYTYNQWYESKTASDPNEAPLYLPQRRESGELFNYHLERARNGEMGKVTEDDYLSLLNSFKE